MLFISWTTLILRRPFLLAKVGKELGRNLRERFQLRRVTAREAQFVVELTPREQLEYRPIERPVILLAIEQLL